MNRDSPETLEASPFHTGERRIQSMLGMREKMENVGGRMLRPFLLDQHRDFFRELPMIWVASLDEDGFPWASLLWGEPGFLSSSDPEHLAVAGRGPQEDPARGHIMPGVRVGLLGLMFENRRRNRLNGTVVHVSGDGSFTLAVGQSFGNCPKYIQQRQWRWRQPGEFTPKAKHVNRGAFSPELIQLLQRADTFFIATSVNGKGGAQDSGTQAAALGADMSHRGGKPGFVHVIDERVFEFPDYSGNFMFNTLGNLMIDPRAAILFPDFESGDLIQCQGEAEILWEEADRARFTGAQRVVRFHLSRVHHTQNVLPFAWSPPQFSPFNP